MSDQPQQQSASVFLASFGWFAAAGVAIWFFVFAMPASREQGRVQGTADQNAKDQAVYEQAFGSIAEPDTQNSTLNARITDLKEGAVVVREIVVSPNLPFNEQAGAQTVVYDQATRLIRRIVITPERYEQKRNQAIAAGENPMMIPPYEDVETTPDALQQGQRLEIVPRDSSKLHAPSLIANEIAIIVEPTQPDPSAF